MDKNTPLTRPAPYPLPNITSIRTGRGGDFEYSPLFLTTGGDCTATSQIIMSGSRHTDRTNYKNAHADPSGHDWLGYQFHHTFSFTDTGRDTSTCNGQMVLSRAHCNTLRHTGAVWQYQQVHGRYKMPLTDFLNSDAYEQDKAAQIFIDEDKKATASDIKKFKFMYMLDIPDWLSDVFQGKTGLPVTCKTTDGSVETIGEIIQLTSESDEMFTVESILDLPNIKEIFKDFFLNKPVIPYASDLCGNIFVCVGDKTYFYDHEADAVLEVSAL